MKRPQTPTEDLLARLGTQFCIDCGKPLNQNDKIVVFSEGPQCKKCYKIWAAKWEHM